MDLISTNKSFLSHHTATTNLSTHTAKAYESDLRDFCGHMGPHATASAVDKEVLRKYIRRMREERGLKETTIKRRVACLKLFFRWANEEGIHANNPFDGLGERIRLPRRLPRALSHDEVKRLRAAIAWDAKADSFHALTGKISVALLMATGIRVGELVTVSVDDFDPSSGSIKIHGKGNRQRMVYVLDPRLSKLITRYKAMRPQHAKPNANLLVSSAGTAINTDRVRLHLRQIASQAGILRALTPHMLRHTAATLWLEGGLDIRYVQKLLGHHSISTTEIYTHVTDVGLRGALARFARSGG